MRANTLIMMAGVKTRVNTMSEPGSESWSEQMRESENTH